MQEHSFFVLNKHNLRCFGGKHLKKLTRKVNQHILGNTRDSDHEIIFISLFDTFPNHILKWSSDYLHLLAGLDFSTVGFYSYSRFYYPFDFIQILFSNRSMLT